LTAEILDEGNCSSFGFRIFISSTPPPPHHFFALSFSPATNFQGRSSRPVGDVLDEPRTPPSMFFPPPLSASFHTRLFGRALDGNLPLSCVSPPPSYCSVRDCRTLTCISPFFPHAPLPLTGAKGCVHAPSAEPVVRRFCRAGARVLPVVCSSPFSFLCPLSCAASGNPHHPLRVLSLLVRPTTSFLPCSPAASP